MKNPLHYQLSEYDCGPTSMMNAIAYLFEREEIPPGGDPKYHALLPGLPQQGRYPGEKGNIQSRDDVPEQLAK